MLFILIYMLKKITGDVIFYINEIFFLYKLHIYCYGRCNLLKKIRDICFQKNITGNAIFFNLYVKSTFI